MTHRIAIVLLIALGFPAQGSEIYKWTDENGKVHYGNAPADGIKQKAEKVELKTPLPTEAQRSDAAARATRNKEIAAAIDEEKAAKTTASAPKNSAVPIAPAPPSAAPPR